MDPRLPGTDFMDTFLVTYRYFTTGKFVLQSLVNFYHHLEEQRTGKQRTLLSPPTDFANNEDDENKDNSGERKISMFLSCVLRSIPMWIFAN